MLCRKKMFIAVSMAVLLCSILLLNTGCDKGGSSSNPVAPTGTGGIRGTLFKDNKVPLASAGQRENILMAFARETKAMLSISVAQAAIQINLNNSSPSSGILVELLFNGSVVASTITGPNGKFEFGGLGPGDYVLRFTKEPDLLIETPISVKEGAITEIEGKITVASTSGNVHLMMEIEKKRTVDHYYENEKKESKKNGNSNEVEIKGIVTSLSPLKVDAGGISYTVTTDSNTEIEGTLAVGVTVEVEGTLINTDTILAKEVEVEETKIAEKKEKHKDKNKNDKDNDDDEKDDEEDDDD